ncbi:MAG: conjugative transposon protein TraJ [Alistipes sp.]|jgi:conjugative transposon TraJ protein|uniref:conjugative transposon protein TraJ n=1 Tax=Alistipes sp. TaxID=1872444 RepID=UPI0023F10126|nr:conjugative transposon protein TraJ [Alistipes sp.]MBS5556863.1 conjugative transposon protein TraJ [Alistipes sp.]
MVHLLSVTENLHLILRVLYDDMMALCAPLTTVASAIAGIGALLYIAYRVWQSLAQAEPLDIFPLLRPFAIGICILFFPTLVLGSLNGILSPLVQATHSLMEGQTLDMQQWQRQRDELERQSRERLPPDSYYVEDEEMERDLAQLGVDDTTQQTLDRMNRERSSWSVKGLLLKGLTWLLELLFAAAGIILDVLRTFYLIVLSLLGPIAFAISVFDGFQNTLVQWLSKYISIYLWLPISDLFSAVIARLQTLSMRHDAEMMAQDYGWYFDASNTVNVIFMFVAICGYLCIPSIASWVVQANGFSSYNRTISQAMSYVSGGAGWLAGRAWAGTKGAAKTTGQGLANAARLIFRR